MLKLSILIPLYNSELYIENCLRSLLDQGIDKKQYEVIIINDGSTDNGLQIVNEYAQKHENIFVYSQVNRGLGAVRNRGISLAKGKFTYFIDSDDYLASNTLSNILDLADKLELDILGFKSMLTSSYNETITKSTNTTTDLIINHGIHYIANNAFKNEVWWYLVNREFLINSGVRFIEGRWMEDTIFTSSLFLEAQRIAYVPIDAHRYVDVPTSAMNNKESSHYNKIIYDNANAAKVYAEHIKRYKFNKDEIYQKCVKRLKTRQESFVFFLIMRALRSNLSFINLKLILRDMKEIEAYPMKHFIGEEYNGLRFKLITAIFNNELLLAIVFRFFKITKKFR